MGEVKPLLDVRMPYPETKLVNNRRIECAITRTLEEIGDYQSVRKFMRKCATLGTKHQYSNALMLYLR